MVIYSLPCGVELDSPKGFQSLFQTHSKTVTCGMLIPTALHCYIFSHRQLSLLFFHRIGSDRPQGFHQALYGSLCALQEEEWELFQYRVDNSK